MEEKIEYFIATQDGYCGIGDTIEDAFVDLQDSTKISDMEEVTFHKSYTIKVKRQFVEVPDNEC